MRKKLFVVLCLAGLLLVFSVAATSFPLRADTAASQLFLPLLVVHEELPPGPSLRQLGAVGGHIGRAYPYGDYAYMALGQEIAILDVMDPANPRPVGQLDLGAGTVWLGFIDDTLYLAAGAQGADHRLIIVDISDPRHARRVGEYPVPGWTTPLQRVGSYAYLATGTDILILDVTDPHAPREAARFNPPWSAHQLHVTGSRAYVVAGDHWDEIRVLDVSIPTQPRELGMFHDRYFDDLWIEDVADGYAYIDESDFDDVNILDVSDPQHMAWASELPTYDPITAQVVGDHAFVTTLGGPLVVFNVANPRQPQRIASLDMPSRGDMVMSIQGNVAYLTNYQTGLVTVDITDADSPRLLGAYTPPSEVYTVAVSGLTAYVGAASGLYLLDMTNPDAPSELSRVTIPCCYHLVVDGAWLHVVSPGEHVRVFDVSDPRQPRFVSDYGDAGDHDSDLDIVAGRAFVTHLNLEIYDVSDPTNPRHLSTYDPPQNRVAGRIAVDGNRVYLVVSVASGVYCPGCYLGSGVISLDISDPTHPQQVGFFPTQRAGDIAVREDLVYLAYSGQGLRILDVTDPSQPGELSAWRTPAGDEGAFGRLALDGGFAFLTGDALRVIDIRTPTAPRELRAYPVDPAGDLALAGDRLYIAARAAGLLTFVVRGGEQ